MSEWKQVDVEFKDEECLIGALKEVGFNPEVHDEATIMENNYSKKEVKAHIIVRKKDFGGYGDFGFTRTKNKGFQCNIDDSDHRTHGKSKTKLGRITQLYSSLVIQKQVKKSSRFSMISKKENENGEIKIRVRRY